MKEEKKSDLHSDTFEPREEMLYRGEKEGKKGRNVAGKKKNPVHRSSLVEQKTFALAIKKEKKKTPTYSLREKGSFPLRNFNGLRKRTPSISAKKGGKNSLFSNRKKKKREIRTSEPSPVLSFPGKKGKKRKSSLKSQEKKKEAIALAEMKGELRKGTGGGAFQGEEKRGVRPMEFAGIRRPKTRRGGRASCLPRGKKKPPQYHPAAKEEAKPRPWPNIAAGLARKRKTQNCAPEGKRKRVRSNFFVKGKKKKKRGKRVPWPFRISRGEVFSVLESGGGGEEGKKKKRVILFLQKKKGRERIDPARRNP